MDVGSLIAERRKALSLTQTQLGEKCGYHGRTAEVTVQNWERSRWHVPIKKIKLVAEILGLSVERLLP